MSKGLLMEKTKIISFCLFLFLITSPTKAQEWEFVGLDSLAVYHLYVSGDTIYAGTIDRNNNPNINDGLYFSSDGGNNWVQLDSALGDGYVNGFYVISPENLYILKSGIIYKTLNHGESWEAINNISSYQLRWFSISPFNANELYCIDMGAIPGGTFNNLYRSSDGGENWETLGPFPGSSHGNELSFAFDLTDSMNVYVSVDDHWTSLYFFKSIDKGDNWFYVSSPPVLPTDIYTDSMIPNKIYLFRGPYISIDGGTSWLEADSGLNNNFYDLSFYQDNRTTNSLYILRTDGLFRSEVDSIFWEKIPGSEILPLDLPPSTRNMKNIIIDGEANKIYIGTSDGLFRKDILTNAPNEIETHINIFVLEQNFPNPFNPRTKIKYHLPVNTNITLKIFDLLGNELATLVNEEKPGGDYEIEFNGENFSSGVYVYTLLAATQRISKKMILLK